MRVIEAYATETRRLLPRVLLGLLGAWIVTTGGCRLFFGPDPQPSQVQTVAIVILFLDANGETQYATDVVESDDQYDTVGNIGAVAGLSGFPQVDPPESVPGASVAYQVPRGESLTLSARSSADSVFWEWAEDLGGNAVGKIVTVDNDLTVGAVFRPDSDILGQLNVSLTADIGRLDAWANSGDTINTLNSHPFSLVVRRTGGGTQYKGQFRAPDAQTAERLPGFEFQKWVITSPERPEPEETPENPVEIVLDRDTEMTAEYQVLTHTFSTAVFPRSDWGSLDVTATYAAPDFQMSSIPEFVPWDGGSNAYLRSTEIAINAQAEPGYRFGGFRIEETAAPGSLRTEEASSFEFSLEADQTVTGLFERDYVVQQRALKSRETGMPDAAAEVVRAPEGVDPDGTGGEEFIYVLGEEARVFEISPTGSSDPAYRGRRDLEVIFPSRDAVVYDPGGSAAPVLFSAHGDDGVRAVRLADLDGTGDLSPTLTLLDWQGGEGSGRAVDLAVGTPGSGNDFLLVADGGEQVRLYELSGDPGSAGWAPQYSDTGSFTVTDATFTRVAAEGTTVLVAQEGPLPEFGASDPFAGDEGQLHLLSYGAGVLTEDGDSPIGGQALGGVFAGSVTHTDEVLYRLQALELADGNTGYLGFIREGFTTDGGGNVTAREVGAALYEIDINNFSTTAGDFVTAEALDGGDPVLSVDNLAFDNVDTVYATTTAAIAGTPTALRSLDVASLGTGSADTVVDSSSLQNGNGLVVVPALDGMSNGTVDAALVADGANGLVRLDAENGGDLARFAPSRFIRGMATGTTSGTRYVAIADDGEGIRIYSDSGDGSFPQEQLLQKPGTILRGLAFSPNGDYLLSSEGAGLTVYDIAATGTPIADTNGTGTYTNGAYTDGVYHAVGSSINPSDDLIVAAGSAGLRRLDNFSFSNATAGTEGELAAADAATMRGELLGTDELVTRRVAALLVDDGGSQREIVLSADGEAGARVVLRGSDGDVVKSAVYFAGDDRPTGSPDLRAADAGALDPTADTVGAAEGVGEVRDVTAWIATQDGEERIFGAFASVDEGLLIAELGTVTELLVASPTPEPTAPVRVRAIPDARSLDFIDGMLVVAGGGGGTHLVDVTNIARPYVIRNYDASAFQIDHVVVYADPGSSDPPAAESARLVIAGSDAQDYLEYLEVQTQ